MAPYLEMIDSLQNKQKEKEAEIVILKYALLEMDRKFTELEKKTKTPAASAGARPAGRTGAGSSSVRGGVASKATAAGKESTASRGSSRAATGASSMQDARQRSKTPTASRMQNTLNTSQMSSKTGVSVRGATAAG